MIKRPNGALSRLHAVHRSKILDSLSQHGPLSRAELARLLAVSRTTTGTICDQLLASGELLETLVRPQSGTAGRPGRKLDLNPKVGFVLGFDFVVGKLRICLLDRRKNVLQYAAMDFPSSVTASSLAALRMRVEELLVANGLEYQGLAAIGLGLIGPVGEQRNRPEPGLFQECFAVPIRANNNVRAAARAELAPYAESGVCNAVYLRLSHGIGSALMVNGQILAGSSDRAGEIGHVVLDRHGPLCPSSGHRGCLEAFSGVDPVVADWSAKQGATLADFHGALVSGEPGARAAAARATDHIGRVLAGLTRVFDPELVVVDGALLDPHGLVLEQLRDSFTDYADGFEHDVPLVRAALDDSAGALGAALGALSDSALRRT